MSGPRRKLTLDEARRALYLDFEGTMVDPPSFLGVLWGEGDDVQCIQLVLEENLWPAVAGKAPTPGRSYLAATWDTVAAVRQRAVDEDRRIVVWSGREESALAKHLDDPEVVAWFKAHLVDAKAIAKSWKYRHHREVVWPREAYAPKHQLQRYLDLIGYETAYIHQGGQTAKRVRTVRAMLPKKGNDYVQLTPGAKKAWTNVLQHNWHDCNGLRELTIRCAEDRP